VKLDPEGWIVEPSMILLASLLVRVTDPVAAPQVVPPIELAVKVTAAGFDRL